MISAKKLYRENITRRRFIKNSLIVTAGAYVGGIGCSEEDDPFSPEDLDEEIIVIGAGISGLAAARKLQANGFTVTILEGRDRIGGRIWSDDSLGVTLDFGAAWIHGIQENPITGLAQSAGAETIVTDFDALKLFDFDGRELTGSEVEEVEDLYEQIFERLENRKNSASDTISMETAVSEVLAEFSLSGTLQRAARWQVASDIELEMAVDLSELSLRYWDEDEKYPGDDVVFPGGFSQIINELSNGLDIKLNQVASEIEMNEQGVEITTNQGAFEVDRAVITLPLGVLKKDIVEFSPQLPDRKLQAIQRLEMGTMNKIGLVFPERFWPSEPHRLGFLEETAGTIMEYWNMHAYIGDPVLVALSRGAHARSLEQMTNSDVVAQAMEDLRKMFGSSIPDPTSSTFTKWNSDPFAHGSYSHVPPGASISDYDIIAEPVEGRLFFAGEATTSTYLGTVHGAFLSGEREADRIIDAVSTFSPSVIV